MDFQHVLVMKASKKWKKCVYCTDLNRACPKEFYLLNIDKLVDNLVGYKLLLFMDSYSGYNKIPMFR